MQCDENHTKHSIESTGHSPLLTIVRYNDVPIAHLYYPCQKQDKKSPAAFMLVFNEVFTILSANLLSSVLPQTKSIFHNFHLHRKFCEERCVCGKIKWNIITLRLN